MTKPPAESKSVVLFSRVTPTLAKRVDRVGKVENRNRSNMVAVLVEEALAAREAKES